MDDKVILTTVGAANIVEVIGTCIDGCVGKASIRLGEDDDIAGHQISIGSGCISVLGNAATCGIGQVVQTSGPAPHGCGGVATIVHGSGLDRIVDVGGINAFDVGQVVADEVGHEGRAHQTVLFELGNIGGLAGLGGAIRHSLVTVQERAVVVVTDIRQNIGIRVIDVTGDILSNIQITIILQPLDIVTGVLQSAQDCIVVHILRDSAHIRHSCDAIVVCSKHGHAEGVLAEHLTGVVVLNRNAIGILDTGIIRKIFLIGFRQHTAQIIEAELIPFLQTHSVILRGLRPVLIRFIFGSLSRSFRFFCGSFGCIGRRLCGLTPRCCFRFCRISLPGRHGGCFRDCRFCRGLGSIIRGRVDRRHESQHQNKDQQ